MRLLLSMLIYTLIIASADVGFNEVVPNNRSEIDYEGFKKSVEHNRSLLSSHQTKDISKYLFKLIDEDIYNYWAGTPWDFHGTTRQPKTGSIACGYFVTTTLTDLGFKIDRVGLAEGRSGDMIKKICVRIRSFNKLNKLDEYLAQQPVNSIFIIGLDFHTGYIVKNTSGCYFFHSYYFKRTGVIKEEMDRSTILNNNKFFMIGSLTANKQLLRKWVAGKPIN